MAHRNNLQVLLFEQNPTIFDALFYVLSQTLNKKYSVTPLHTNLE